MITFTKEQLIASAHARIEFAEMMLAGELEPLKERTWSIELELARIALASLEAEPVAEWTNKQCLEFLSIAFRHAEINGDLQLDDIRLGVKIVNGSRAAMLQGTDGNSPVIPEGWVACSERMPEGMQTVITSNGFDIGQGWWDGEGWNSFDSHDVVPGDATHWMLLPSAPQQE